MASDYGITFVGDDVLAEGQDFAFVSRSDGSTRIFYRESAICPAVLEASWAAYRALEDDGGHGGTPTQMDEPDMRTVLRLVAGGYA